jgi:hypothetical protein
VAGAGLVALAPPAEADTTDLTFLTTLDAVGVPYSSAISAVNAGHAVCLLLDQGRSPRTVVEEVQDKAGLTAHQASALATIAAAAYCKDYAREMQAYTGL